MTGHRASTVLLVATVGFAVLFSGALASPSPTGFEVASQFSSFYSRSGGLSNFGYAISPPETQSGRLVQYFERQRFESHPELAGTPYQVELGRLGADAAKSSGIINSSPFQPLPSNTTSDANCTFFPQTRHRLCASFRHYWQSNGVEFGDPGVSFRESLALFGYPISEEFRDPSSGLVVQYFERARFEYHPEFAGTKYEVELTLLGRPAMTGDYATILSTDNSVSAAASSYSGVLFGIYPKGDSYEVGNGQVSYVPPPSGSQLIASIDQLRGTKPFNVHLYTAWSWYNQQALDTDVNRFTQAGLGVTLTIKYSPPDGHTGDASGYAQFVRKVVDHYGSNPMVTGYVIGNEINLVNGDPAPSDGPIPGVQNAIVQGVIAAREELTTIGSSASVGTNIAIQSRAVDTQFLYDLAQLGGDSFKSSISFLGINVYPGVWPVGTGDPYADMVTYLENTRYALNHAGFGGNVSIAILENGYPTLDENAQAYRLGAFVRAVCDSAASLNISRYDWFGLWDANSASSSILGHYGLLRSDLTHKPAFAKYQQAISGQCSASNQRRFSDVVTPT